MPSLVDTMDLPDQHEIPLLKKYDIPVNHLDYEYVEKCNDGRELEKILHVLQSGEEGYYPDLIAKVEMKIVKIKPDSTFIQKITPVLSVTMLNDQEREAVNQDVNDFIMKIDKMDNEIKEIGGARSISETECPIRSRQVLTDCGERAVTDNQIRRIKSTDYEAWNKYDVDTEILKLDLEKERLREEGRRIEKKASEQSSSVKSVRFNEFATEAEAAIAAEQERLKGNECYKAGELDNAVKYYSVSISYKATVAAFNNRALVYSKKKQFENAVADAKKAIELESNNVKARLRLALCFKQLGDHQQAFHAAETVISIDPNCNEAQEIVAELRPRVAPKSSSSATRIAIEDVSISAPKKTALKKRSQSAQKNVVILPLPGTSKMSAPHYKVVDGSDPEVVRREQMKIDNQPRLHYMGNVYGSDDEDDDVVDDDKNGNINDTYVRQMPEPLFLGDSENSENNPAHDVFQTQEGKAEDEKTAPSNNSGTQSIDHKDSELRIGIEDCDQLPALTVNDEAECIECVTTGDGGTGNNKLTNSLPGDRFTELNNNSEDSLQPVREDLFRRSWNSEIEENDKGGGGEPYSDNNNTTPPEIREPYRFLTTWNSLRRDNTFESHASVLQTLDLRTLPIIIGMKLDPTMLSEIVQALYRHFTVADKIWMVSDAIRALPRIPRFGINAMLMGDEDRACVKNLIQFLEQHDQGLSCDEASAYGF